MNRPNLYTTEHNTEKRAREMEYQPEPIAPYFVALACLVILAAIWAFTGF